MGKTGLVVIALVAVAIFAAAPASGEQTDAEEADKALQPIDDKVTQGALRVRQADNSVVECPLKHTDVAADVSGFIARVKVTQTFYNPFKDKIEAVYVFPLPHGSAVDDMTMVIGDRRIVGLIRKRDTARAIYEQAIAQGRTAALLEQERPNIFVQSVGNIDPGQEIRIEISYLDVLEYDMGEYTFHFPMVVGPRFNPPGSAGGIGAAPVGAPGASGQKTEIEYMKPGQRNGHDIALSLNLNAGVPVRDLRSTSHNAEVMQVDATRAAAKLLPADSIPNKDFVVKYKVAGEKPEMALLAHNLGEGSDGYFMLMIQPRLDDELAKAPPREVCFLIDVSGSMRGRPTEQVKQTMEQFFKLSKPDDTIQVVTFAGQANALFEKYLPATQANVEKALDFTRSIQGGGGTMMIEGIKKVVEEPVAPDRVRIVIMLTDGYIGNEKQIIDEVDRRCGDQIRFWAVGIGNSVNRFLIDGVARQGGGMGKVLGLGDNPAELVPEIVERIHRAQLSNIRIDWNSLGVYDIYPMRVPELWAGRPVVLHGKFYEAGRDVIMINGLIEGKPVSYPLEVALPDAEAAHNVLAPVWARKKIEDLSYQMMGSEVQELVDEITDTALTYRLMSQYTSFVAVDEKDLGTLREPATPPRRVTVPVPMPDGVSFSGVFGPGEMRMLVDELEDAPLVIEKLALGRPMNAPMEMEQSRRAYRFSGGGVAMEKAKEGGGFTMAAPSLAPAPMAMPAAGAYGLRGGAGRSRSLLRAEAGDAMDEGIAAPGTATELRKVLKVRYENKPLGEVLEALSKGFDTKIVMDEDIRDAAAKMPVHLNSGDQEVPLSTALAWIQQGTGYGFTVKDGIVHLQKGAWQLAEECRVAAAAAVKAGKLAEAVSLLRKACMLAGSDSDYRARNIGQMALNDLLSAREAVVAAQIETLPDLKKQLDIVLEHTSLSEAIAAIGKAAGIEINVIDGSLDDVRELLEIKYLDVVYLDLRNATVAESLCWLLDPFQLDWAVDGKRIAVGTSRRLATDAPAPWVYTIAELSVPLEDEFGEDKEANRKLLLDSREEVLACIKAVVDPAKVRELDFDRIMVDGTAADHQGVGSLLAALRSGKQLEALPQAAAAIAAKTARRYAARAEPRAGRIAANERAAVSDALRQYSWKLMADGLAGTADRETLAWLSYAWNHAECGNAIKADTSLSARALWTVAASARLLPDNAAVQALAKKAAQLAVAAPAARGVQGQASLLQHLLAVRDFGAVGIKAPAFDDKYIASARAALDKAGQGGAAVTSALLDDLDAKQRDELAAKLREAAPAVRGDDAVVLFALACRRAGGEAWARFRSELRLELIQRVRPGGDALLITNRLSAPALALVK